MNISRYRSVSIGVSGRTITIHTGEFVLPLLVLLFIGIYYVGTRGLPQRSMMYAGPLMYITLGLAVITLFQHGFSINGSNQNLEEYQQGREERKTAEVSESTQTEDDNKNQHFNRRSATGLVVLTFGYIMAITPLGFIPATTIFLAAVLFMFGERHPLTIAAYSGGFALLVWAIFIYWLKVPL